MERHEGAEGRVTLTVFVKAGDDILACIDEAAPDEVRVLLRVVDIETQVDLLKVILGEVGDA